MVEELATLGRVKYGTLLESLQTDKKELTPPIIRHIDFVATTCLPCPQNDIAALSKYRTAYYLLLSSIVLNVDLFWPFCK